MNESKNKFKIFLLAGAIIFLIGFIAFLLEGANRIVKSKNMQEIFLKTIDDINISANYYSKPENKKAAILVHMMPATKESWNDFAAALLEKGYNGIAIDLRGHGSSSGGPDGWKSFSDEEHQASILDLEAAYDFIKKKGFADDTITCIGASIGANLCLQFLVNHPTIPQAVLLSPGINYRGIKTEPLMQELRPGQRVLLVGSNDDPQSNINVISQLVMQNASGAEVKSLIYQNAGHGTNMFGREMPDLKSEILNWLR
jgi:alpha-beta hydrolase superfamily lysophospholipase